MEHIIHTIWALKEISWVVNLSKCNEGIVGAPVFSVLSNAVLVAGW